MNNGTESRFERVVPRGCMILAIFVILGLGVAGYYGYHYFREVMDMPEELMAYWDADSMFTMIESRTPAPSDETHLTPEWVAMYTGAIDTISANIDGFRVMLDSVQGANAREGDSGAVAIWSNPTLMRESALLIPRGRRDLVTYLNARGRSWAEYLWAKERVIAASGITREEIQDAATVLMNSYFGGDNSNKVKLDEGDDDTYNRIEELRASGRIDSNEIRLVAPHRGKLLSSGLFSLLNFETERTEPGMDFNIGTEEKGN